MTKLRPSFPLIRETDCYERSDSLIVSLHPRFLSIRLKGHREAFELDYGAILDLARKQAWRRQKGA